MGLPKPKHARWLAQFNRRKVNRPQLRAALARGWSNLSTPDLLERLAPHRGRNPEDAMTEYQATRSAYEEAARAYRKGPRTVEARVERKKLYRATWNARGRLRRALFMDPKYDIFNDNFFTGRLFRILRGKERGGVPRNYSFAMIDVDGLKQINTRGRLKTGDKAIAGLADILNHVAAELGGFAARRSKGDEFKLFVPASKERLMRALAEAQRRFQAIPAPNRIVFGFSAGVVGKADVGAAESEQEIVKRLNNWAESASLVAKKAGKRRTVAYLPRMRSN